MALPAAISLSLRPVAKRQQTGVQRTVNQLPYIDFMADDINNDGKGGKGAKEMQDKIVAIMPGFVNLLFDQLGYMGDDIGIVGNVGNVWV